MSINLHKKESRQAWRECIKNCWIKSFYDDRGTTRRGLIWILPYDIEHEKGILKEKTPAESQWFAYVIYSLENKKY